MANLLLRVLVIPIAVAVFAGCVSSQETNAARGATPDDRVNGLQAETKTESIDAQSETKVGVIDVMEVLKRTKLGQPAMARWKREVEEANRRKEQHMTQFHQATQYHQHWESPWETARRNAVNSIIPTVELVTKVVAERQGFGIVMAKGNPDTVMTTFYSADIVDLTEQVIEELNRRFP